MNRPPKTHWLRENSLERSPHRVLVVDTETSPLDPDDPERQVLRLWCARLERRRGVDPRKPRLDEFTGTTAGELADLIEGLARSDHALWVFTHNLNFDLAVTQLPVHLATRGWRVTEGALTTDSPWCRMAKGSRRLAIADTWSWLPTSVEKLGQLVRLRKLPLPHGADPEAAWWERCRRDVAITHKALAQVMDWWDAGHYGNWSITGPATGWSSYRHRRPAPRVLIEPDPVARELEARAISGGRRQVNRVGRLADGLYADLDLATAHLTVMSECRLPFRRVRAFDSLDVNDGRLSAVSLDVLAECVVATRTPRYPWDSGLGWFYPTGRFSTVLAGPELRDAAQRGELVSIGRGYVYGMRPHMADWARWVASLLAIESPDVPPAVRLMAKHWTRSVPGKWGGHASEVLERVPDPRPGWGLERGFVSDGRRPASFLLVGGERWTVLADQWADDAFPAILAWVQSYTRVAMGRIMDALGPAVVSCNTDGALVDVNAALALDGLQAPRGGASPTRKLQALAAYCVGLDPELEPFMVRVKSAATSVRVISPQHLILDGERHLAGVPQRAQTLGGGRYRFTQWPKLRVQLQRERPVGYTTQRRTVDLSGVPAPGWLWANGDVTPVELDGDQVVPLASSYLDSPLGDAHRLAPLERQHPLLRRALRTWPDWAPVLEATGRPRRPRNLKVAS